MAPAEVQGLLALEIQAEGWRPRVDAEVRQLIRPMSIDNPLWGAPKIHGELLLLGCKVSQTTVAKYMVKRRSNPSGQTWKTFLKNHRDGIASIDIIIVPTNSLQASLLSRHSEPCKTQIIHCAVTIVPTAAWVARQITEAYPWDNAPEYLIRDTDPVFNAFLQRKLRLIGIRNRPTTPHSPWQNGHS